MFRRKKASEESGAAAAGEGEIPGHELPALKPFLRPMAEEPARSAAPQQRVELTRRLADMTGASRPSAPAPAYVPHPGSLAPISENEGKKLIVGRDIRLHGEIAACEHLVVEGSVEATLNDGKVIDIAEAGTFRGAVECETAMIRGRFDGELTCHDKLIVRATGRVLGKVRYAQLEVERGGEISGDVQMLHQEEIQTEAPAKPMINGESESDHAALAAAAEQ